MALTYSKNVEAGTSAPDFKLPATDGKTYTLDTFKDRKVLVVVFTCNHCPYAKASEERLITMQNEFAKRGVQFVLINSNDDVTHPDDSFDKMKERSKEKKFPFPYLRDATQNIAKAYNAACTPDIFVYDENRKLRYNGRIDDNWQEPQNVKRHDLQSAILAVLENKPLPFTPVPSMGCNIKWKQ